jgi:hypothetical protein
MIELYNSRKPTHGLVRVRNRWFLVFKEDGVQRRMSLGTTDEAEARRVRDEAYAKLIAEGAILCPRKTGRPKITPPGFTGTLPDGVSYRHPWQARVGKKNLGYFPTMADAEARVRGYLSGNAEVRHGAKNADIN